MTEFYRGDKEDVKIRIARLLIQERATYLATYPLGLADIISLSTYDPNATNGWKDFGLTVSPAEESEAFETTGIDTQQKGLINTRKGNYTRTVTFAPAEYDRQVLEMVKGGSGYNDDAVNRERRLFFANKKAEKEYRLALLDQQEDGLISATVFPCIKRSGDATTRTWDKGAAQEFPVTCNILADENILDDDGDEVAVYDIYQY